MALRLGYFLNGVFTPLKETESAFYYYQAQYYPVTAESLAQWEGYTDRLGVIITNGRCTHSLASGQSFVLAPKQKKQGYFLGSTFVEITPTQTAYYYYNGEYVQANPEFYNQWAPLKGSFNTAIFEGGESKWLPQGTLIQYCEEQSPVLPTNALRKKCSICSKYKEDYYYLTSRIICIPCLKQKYFSDQLFEGANDKSAHWSSMMIHEVYTVLKERLPSEEQYLLGETVKLPLESFVCVGSNQPDAPGYPPEGHICGNLSKLSGESGCPAHPLCKRCADRLEYCPKDGNVIVYEEILPLECPKGCGNCITKDRPCSKCNTKAPYWKAVNANK